MTEGSHLAETPRRYCYPACRDPWFYECADCWQDGGNAALWPAPADPSGSALSGPPEEDAK